MKTRDITITAIMIALSVVLAFVKVPSPTGSVALDALPAYALAGILGPVYGGIVGFVGHLASASTGGFFMGLHLHVLVAFIMFGAAYAFGFFYKKDQKLLSIAAGLMVNVVISLAIFTYLNGWGFFTMMWLPLTVGSLINIVLGFIVIKPIKDALSKF